MECVAKEIAPRAWNLPALCPALEFEAHMELWGLLLVCVWHWGGGEAGSFSFQSSSCSELEALTWNKVCFLEWSIGASSIFTSSIFKWLTVQGHPEICLQELKSNDLTDIFSYLWVLPDSCSVLVLEPSLPIKPCFHNYYIIILYLLYEYIIYVIMLYFIISCISNKFLL